MQTIYSRTVQWDIHPESRKISTFRLREKFVHSVLTLFLGKFYFWDLLGTSGVSVAAIAGGWDYLVNAFPHL